MGRWLAGDNDALGVYCRSDFAGSNGRCFDSVGPSINWIYCPRVRDRVRM
jgi:hypothetical protein